MNPGDTSVSFQTAEKILVLRLSSLGDVIMASAALEALPTHAVVDWVVSAEYGDLLSGHSRLRSVWRFDRRSGLRGWIRMCHRLHEEGYSTVLDLHNSLRSRVARCLFAYWDAARWVRAGKLGSRTQWRRVSKQRFRVYGYYLFKRAWPVAWRPHLWVQRHARIAGGRGDERPDLKHLGKAPVDPALESAWADKPWLCVMPASRWDGKKWPVARYAEACARLQGKFLPVVLGTRSDRESLELASELEKARIPHFSAVGLWDLRQTASALMRSAGYVGNDTGLAYLAEAVGTRAVVIFGPTTPDLGFGPWGRGSEAAGTGLWCRPCGKDGRSCFRIRQRYLCLSSLGSDSVCEAVERTMGERSRG